jgi:hypothetical protein
MPPARALVRADAIFEVVLGVPLATSRRTGLIRRLRVPAPDGLVVAFGAGLLPFAGVLWALAERPGRAPVLALAGVNAATAATLGGWLLARREEFDGAGAAVVAGTAAALAGFAVTEARAVA